MRREASGWQLVRPWLRWSARCFPAIVLLLGVVGAGVLGPGCRTNEDRIDQKRAAKMARGALDSYCRNRRIDPRAYQEVIAPPGYKRPQEGWIFSFAADQKPAMAVQVLADGTITISELVFFIKPAVKTSAAPAAHS